MKGASTCNLELGQHDVLDKNTKVKFGTRTHRLEGLHNSVHVDIWDPTKTASLKVHQYFISFIDDISR